MSVSECDVSAHLRACVAPHFPEKRFLRGGRWQAGPEPLQTGPGCHAPSPVIHVPVSPPPPLQEFVHLAKRLVSDPALEKGIVANGREYVRTFHSWQAERATYQHLVRTLGGSED